MGSMEKKSDLDILARINDELDKKYETKTFGNRVCFVNKNAVPFNAFAMEGEEAAFGIEYADDGASAERGTFEDGDTFYLADYDTVDAMIQAMCEEIDNA